MNVVYIGKYLLSFPGGAERSIFEELQEHVKKGDKVDAITFESILAWKTKQFGMHIHNHPFKRKIQMSQFWENHLNKKYIETILMQHFELLAYADKIIVQSLITPYVVWFLLKYNLGHYYDYYIRDELNLNEFHNYEQGVRKLYKVAKSILECYPIYYYRITNKLALKNAYKIIANSKFMQDELKRKFNLESEVKYPKLNPKLKGLKLRGEKVYISFIGGGNFSKGYDIAIKIAAAMPEEKFLIVESYRNFQSKCKLKNVTFVPWGEDIVDSVYSKSKLLIIPSRWKEAYGRVAIEAKELGIPVVTSDKGGLPETKPDAIVKDLEDINQWVKEIRGVLNEKKK